MIRNSKERGYLYSSAFNAKCAGRALQAWRQRIRVSRVLAPLFLVIASAGCDEKPELRSERFEKREKAGQRKPPALARFAVAPSSSSPAAVDLVTNAERDLEASSEAAKWKAVDKLVKDGSARAIEVLAHHIQSLPLGPCREEVVRRASTVANKQALATVLELLSEAEDPSVIRMSQEIFIRIADAEAIQHVLDRYDSSADADLRRRLEKTIALTFGPEAVAPLRLLVLGQGQPLNDGMVLAGAHALARNGTQPAVDALLARLDTEPTEEGRSLIADILREVREPAAEDTLQGAALGGGKFSTTQQTRIAAIGALLNYPSTETQALLAGLSSDRDPDIGAAAVGILDEMRRLFVSK